MKKFTLIVLLLISGIAYSQNSQLTVIGNQNAVPAQLTMAEFKTILLGNKPKWNAADKVIITMMKLNTEAGKSICSKVYGMTPDEVKKYWLTLSFKGEVAAPVFFNTANEVQDFVSKNRGAIGILDLPGVIPNTKIVLIDGKKTF